MATQTQKRRGVKNAHSRSPNIMTNIKKLLLDYGAIDVNERNPRPGETKTGFPNSLTFSMMVKGQELHFRLEANYAKVRSALLAETTTIAQINKLTPAYVAQVTWATLKDYLDVSLALVRINAMDAHEVLLGQLLAPGSDRRFFTVLDEQQYQQLPERAEGGAYGYHITEADGD